MAGYELFLLVIYHGKNAQTSDVSVWFFPPDSATQNSNAAI